MKTPKRIRRILILTEENDIFVYTSVKKLIKNHPQLQKEQMKIYYKLAQKNGVYTKNSITIYRKQI